MFLAIILALLGLVLQASSTPWGSIYISNQGQARPPSNTPSQFIRNQPQRSGGPPPFATGGGSGGPPPFVTNPSAGGPPPFVTGGGSGGPPPFVTGGGPPAFGPDTPGFFPGTCPELTNSVSDFERDQFLGRWYQTEGLPQFFSPADSRCISALYGLNNNGSISVRNSQVTGSGDFDELCGFAFPNPDQRQFPGRLEVRLQNSPPGAYTVLGTDYQNYASAFSCSELPGGAGKLVGSWILTRSQFPSEEILKVARQKFLDNNLDISGFVTVDHRYCIYDNPNGGDCF